MMPRNPHSSAMTARMKSVCWTGRKRSWLWVPLRKPFPENPPEPTAILLWRT